MHEKVKEFLLECKEKEDRERDKLLIELGMFEKEYSPDNSYNEEYRFSEWNNTEEETYYYRKKAVQVSNEEFAYIKKYANKELSSSGNGVATALTVIAVIIYIAAFIAGIALGQVEITKGYYYSYTTTEFSWGIAFIYWSIGFISGTMFLGFAEIIKLLTVIKNK